MERIFFLKSLVWSTAAATLFTATGAYAADWITWDGSSPGTPPVITLDESASNQDVSQYTIVTHGFYIEEVILEGQVYHRILIPRPGEFPSAEAISLDPTLSLPVFQELGLPELPFDAAMLGMGTEQADS